jgi:hypothetical protein
MGGITSWEEGGRKNTIERALTKSRKSRRIE